MLQKEIFKVFLGELHSVVPSKGQRGHCTEQEWWAQSPILNGLSPSSASLAVWQGEVCGWGLCMDKGRTLTSTLHDTRSQWRVLIWYFFPLCQFVKRSMRMCIRRTNVQQVITNKETVIHSHWWCRRFGGSRLTEFSLPLCPTTSQQSLTVIQDNVNDVSCPRMEDGCQPSVRSYKNAKGNRIY